MLFTAVKKSKTTRLKLHLNPLKNQIVEIKNEKDTIVGGGMLVPII